MENVSLKISMLKYLMLLEAIFIYTILGLN